LAAGDARKPFTSEQVLVLNANYEPLNITSMRRALVLLLMDKASTVKLDSLTFHSERQEIRAPTVVKLRYYVHRPVPELRLSRALLARDNYTCQYCGKRTRPLTLDHVLPKTRGGKTTWENLVACCARCNAKKGDRTPEEAGMRLLRKPIRPKFIPYISLSKFIAACNRPDWREFLTPFAKDLPLADYGLDR